MVCINPLALANFDLFVILMQTWHTPVFYLLCYLSIVDWVYVNPNQNLNSQLEHFFLNSSNSCNIKLKNKHIWCMWRKYHVSLFLALINFTKRIIAFRTKIECTKCPPIRDYFRALQNKRLWYFFSEPQRLPTSSVKLIIWKNERFRENTKCGSMSDIGYQLSYLTLNNDGWYQKTEGIIAKDTGLKLKPSTSSLLCIIV